MLLDTGDAVLIEDTYQYGDNIWGAAGGKGRPDLDGTGRNLLGQILMHVRQEIRDGAEYPFIERTADYYRGHAIGAQQAHARAQQSAQKKPTRKRSR